MKVLRTTLFLGGDVNTYVIIDGASCKELLGQLHEHAPEHVCLYAGELRPDLQQCAPYLIALPPDHAFTDWVVENCFGKHWGIFAHSPAGLLVLRKHFRTFLIVKNSEGKRLYFRYYDPRVLRTYLPTCSATDLELIFGPVTAYIFEQVKPPSVVKFTVKDGAAKRERVAAAVDPKRKEKYA